MKKKKKEDVLKLLKNRKKTYAELAKITGYHEKYLIKLNKIAKKNNYQYINKNIGKQNHLINNDIKHKIKEEWLKNYYKNYITFYNYLINKYNFQISYSFLCRFLSNINYSLNCLIIKKDKMNNKYFNIAIDYQTKTILCYNENSKNSYKSVKNLLLKVFIRNGIPPNITFINLFNKSNPFNKILSKYGIRILPITNKFSNTKWIHQNNKIEYCKKELDLKDFYERKDLKTIENNIIQFDNIRYKINSEIFIKRLENVTLFYNYINNHKFVIYKNKIFPLKKHKILYSKKGLSKYN